MSDELVFFDSIHCFSLLFAHQPELDVAFHGGAVALLGVAEAAAAGHLDDEALAGRDRLEALRPHHFAGGERQAAVAAGLAAVAAAGGMLDPFEGGEDAERRAFAMLDLHYLAQAAATLAGAARVGTIFLLPDDDGRNRLGDLDRHVAHAGGE